MENMKEIEAKFFVKDLNQMEARLQKLEARLLQPRTRESNLRFDTPNHDLRREGRVLRLRQDDEARMTYKSASNKSEGVLSRTEIEFVVEDFDRAKQFLEALGFVKLVFYEKYRTTYEFPNAHVMLDELPIGNFVEIEGESAESIRSLAEKLGLRWDAAVSTSYHALFERVREAKRLDVDDLSFANFEGIDVTESELRVEAAD